MRTMRRFAWAALVLAVPLRAGAIGQIATDPFQFLFLDANARASAMGGAYTALAFDSNALLYNPGGLGLADRYEGTFMHHESVHNLTQEYIGICIKQGWGVNANYRTWGNMRKTTVDNPDGRDLGHFTIVDLATSIGYGRKILPNLGFGVGYKYIREAVESVAANTHAVDAGLLFMPRPRMAFGFAVQNLGPTFRFSGASENLPMNFRWGGAYGFDLFGAAFIAAVDGTKQRGDRADVAVGIEGTLHRRASLRMGYASRNDSGPGVTAGVGFKFDYLQLDYAMTPNGALGWSHRASLTFRWGGGDDWPQYDAPPVKLRPWTPDSVSTKAEEPPQAQPKPKPKRLPAKR